MLSSVACIRVANGPYMIADSVAAFVVESGGTGLGNGWFAGVALDTLAAFMVRACVAGGGGSPGKRAGPESAQVAPGCRA